MKKLDLTSHPTVVECLSKIHTLDLGDQNRCLLRRNNPGGMSCWAIRVSESSRSFIHGDCVASLGVSERQEGVLRIESGDRDS